MALDSMGHGKSWNSALFCTARICHTLSLRAALASPPITRLSYQIIFLVPMFAHLKSYLNL